MQSAIISKLAKSAKVATLSGVLLLAAACSPVAGDSLLTDQNLETSSFTLDKTAKTEELYLKVYNPNLNPGTSTKAEVSGECYVSTYPKHEIVARLSSNGGIIPLIDVSGSASTTSNTAVCRNGKFNFSINAGALAAGAQYSIRVSLRAYATVASSVPITNDTQGATTIKLTK